MNPHTGRPIVTHGPTRLSNAEVRELLVRHGFPDPDKWLPIVLRESGGDPAVVVDTTGMSPDELFAYWKKKSAPEVSVGLFQINVTANAARLKSLGVAYTVEALQDPDANAQAAFALSGGGTNFAPWGG